MGLLGKLFGAGNSSKMKELMANGAKVVDVRSAAEFSQGHLTGSINIPMGEVQDRINEMKAWETPIIFICASGIRSGKVASSMKSKGLNQVHNGGGWQSLK